MNIFYAIFFGAGLAAIAYTVLGKRVGYGNTSQVATLVGVIFVLSTIVFYTIINLLPTNN